MPKYNMNQYNKVMAASLRLQKQKQDAARNARLGELGYRPGGHSGGAKQPVYRRPQGPVVV